MSTQRRMRCARASTAQLLWTNAALDKTSPYLSSSLRATPRELLLQRLLPALHTPVLLLLRPQLPVLRTLQQLQLQPLRYLLLQLQLLLLRLLGLKPLLA